ncbi:MAG: STAS domain-containing protein [Firmicutes bacterium]|nr:STAS domain-containing protein [Bacillota bacterium]
MKSKIYLNKEWLWVHPEGELDMASAEQFRGELADAMAAGGYRWLWLDMSAVTFIDSSGLGVILGRYRQLQPMGGSIIITRPSEQIYRLLTAAGLHRIMEIDRPLSLRFREEGI